MAAIDARAALERLIRATKADYAGLSRLLGRNPAYIQQYIKRGIPRRLSEDDRRTLARFFGVSEAALGGPTRLVGAGGEPRMHQVPRLDLGASAGAGAADGGEAMVSHMAFDHAWLKRLCGARAEDLSIIRVEGDSMAPTLHDGDEIMVDRSDAATRLRDGIYVLRRDDALVVKRLALDPVAGRVAIRSDNPDYPRWSDCERADIAIVGRVVWCARAMR